MNKHTMLWLAIGAGVILLFKASSNSAAAASGTQTANADIATAQGAFSLLAQDITTLGTSLNSFGV